MSFQAFLSDYIVQIMSKNFGFKFISVPLSVSELMSDPELDDGSGTHEWSGTHDWSGTDANLEPCSFRNRLFKPDPDTIRTLIPIRKWFPMRNLMPIQNHCSLRNNHRKLLFNPELRPNLDSLFNPKSRITFKQDLHIPFFKIWQNRTQTFCSLKFIKHNSQLTVLSNSLVLKYGGPRW